VIVPPKGYLEGVRNICDDNGIVLVADEVMSGFGRTGKWFGFMHSNPMLTPDIVTMAKGNLSSFNRIILILK
jgi:taurine---2-oxoglutarate transaminase